MKIVWLRKLSAVYSVALTMAIMLSVAPARAQVVDKVKGNEVWVSGIKEEKFQVGDKVNFLDDGLNHKGQGTVKKVSDGQANMIVVIDSDAKITTGMRVEREGGRAAGGGSSAKTISYSQLSEEDRGILNRGEISTTSYVVGGILGTYPIGFGVGHAIQGRYSEAGWKFTVGELASLGVLVAGLDRCGESLFSGDDCDNGLIALGLWSFVGFRIWEIVDVWAVPPEQNRRYRDLKSRVGKTDDDKFKWNGLSAMPMGDGLTVGAQFRF